MIHSRRAYYAKSSPTIIHECIIIDFCVLSPIVACVRARARVRVRTHMYARPASFTRSAVRFSVRTAWKNVRIGGSRRRYLFAFSIRVLGLEFSFVTESIQAWQNANTKYRQQKINTGIWCLKIINAFFISDQSQRYFNKMIWFMLSLDLLFDRLCC